LVLFAFGVFTYLSPRSPFQPGKLIALQSYYRLERGVKGRGGCAPSQMLSPFQTNKQKQYKCLEFERGIKGVSVSNQPNENSTLSFIQSFSLLLGNSGRLR
jgi:hypothetical protein